MLLPWTYDLRDWQQRAFYAYITANKRDFLMVATPGAGKTIAAIRIAHNLMSTDKIERIVVVCPTEHLKKQWAKVFARFGIALDYEWKNATGAIAPDFQGIIATYQQVASNPEIHRIHCRRPTLLIADEIHHAGDDKSWGSTIQHAFSSAVCRLSLSGTPFRSDGTTIPFVEYTDDGEGTLHSKADFSYGYGAALRENVCRPVLFPSYEGNMEWSSGLETMRATFRTELPEAEARRRLRTALDPKGQWIWEVLRAANQRLSEIRANGHPRAAGLVLCSDVIHARLVADTLHKATGETATIALSDEDGASERITAFADGDSRWIIAVRMVSEGVDIPRLRIGVYATHWIAELFFRQVVGRFVRVVEGVDEQSAFLYIPRDDVLVSFAQRIKEERDHELDQEIDDLRKELSERAERQQTTLYSPIASEALADDVIFDHQNLNQREIEEARTICLQIGISIPPELMARAFRLRGTPLVIDATPPARTERVDTLREQKDKWRKAIKRLAAQLVTASNRALDYQAIYYTLMQQDGVKQDHATIDQLVARADYLRNWIERYRSGQAT